MTVEAKIIPPNQNETVLDVGDLSKSFPSQVALREVSLRIRAGSIHALVGENGSGKSTLIKVLSGFHEPDPGSRIEAKFGHQMRQIGTEGWNAGIVFVHQELGLVGRLSARENLSLVGLNKTTTLRPINDLIERTEIRKVLDTFASDINVDVPIDELESQERAAIAISRAVASVNEFTRLVVFDEPTVALSQPQVNQLFVLIRSLAARQIGILYVSHHLREIEQIADTVTVIRDGFIVGELHGDGISVSGMVDCMLGRRLDNDSSTKRARTKASVVLKARNLETATLKGLSFDLFEGEILGVTGLLGSGFNSIPRVFAGLEQFRGGSISVDSRPMRSMKPRTAHKIGVATMLADRRRLGLIAEHSIRENLSLPKFPPVSSRGLISPRRETEDAEKWIEQLRVDVKDPERLVAELSGGNQQKVLIAKWLRMRPSVFVVEEPSQAVDVGAKASIERTLRNLAEQGLSIIVCSVDASDLVRICNRVLVVNEGVVQCEFSGETKTERLIVEAVHGASEAGDSG